MNSFDQVDSWTTMLCWVFFPKLRFQLPLINQTLSSPTKTTPGNAERVSINANGQFVITIEKKKSPVIQTNPTKVSPTPLDVQMRHC